MNWSAREKQIARAVFERAAFEEEKELLELCRARAAALKDLEEVRALEVWIRDSLREYQYKYDYRYSQLLMVFARLVREGRVEIELLEGLDDEKLLYIKRVVSL
ncbi:MAG: hypothetical protein ACKOD9_07290 [Rubrivivax sp.]